MNDKFIIKEFITLLLFVNIDFDVVNIISILR